LAACSNLTPEQKAIIESLLKLNQANQATCK
jgi:hypothetical protein